MKKNRYFDLKKNHFILSEIGIICSLLFLIAATNVNIGSEKDSGILEQPSIDPARIIDLPPVTPPEKVAQNIGIEGRVHVQFIIDKQGRVTDPEIIRGVHPELDAEVLRVIKLVRFSPGVQNGVLVKVKMVQSVNFKLKR